MTERTRLPNSRASEIVDFWFLDKPYRVLFSVFPNGMLAEMFLSPVRQRGNDMDTALQDLATCASIALQYGAPIETLRHACGMNADGSAVGIFGAAIDAIFAGEKN